MSPLPPYLQKAMADYKKGNFAAVVATLEKQARLAPLKQDAALLFLAQSHYRLGNMAQAGRAYLACSRLGGEKALDFAKIALPLLQKHGTETDVASAVERLYELEPRNFEYAGVYLQNIRKNLELDKMAAFEALSRKAWLSGDPYYLSLEGPFANIGWCTDEDINARTALMLGGKITPPPDPVRRRARQHRFADKIRVGYLSDDFFDSHASMIMFQGIPDFHDRSKFDITLFCYTSEENIAKDSQFRKRHQFTRIETLSDEQAVHLMREREIDILVDLKGYTKGARSAIFNLGAAPIQVAYYGYAGSAFDIDCDYVIGDDIVLPDSSKPHYREKFSQLPDTYFCYDSLSKTVPEPMSRQEAGLSPDVFVFAAFNSLRKINRHTLDLWCQILSAVPNSILWMLCEDEIVRGNLRKEVVARGLAAERIVFAQPFIHRFHLARVQAADLALDSFPFNGHTTTADMLWAGLPVVTYRGSHFASRVSESVLHALDADDLVAETPDDFVRLAVALAQDPDRLAAMREKIRQNRFIKPLFDTERITRHLENAYEIMAERARNGLEPDHFNVPALPARNSPFKT
jgi:predicted O-linked N-acetylglucosamine transferase (SPINDLY family)